ncbi:glycosyltransferase [Enterobacteriaceae bacterium RIT714]|nr:glycosyltransferase [Enterobacteriaceae bacterium RIT714]
MKLALIIDDYLPSSTRVGAKMFHELALELQSHGHTITVITPECCQVKTLMIDDLDGITVWRFKSGPLKDVGRIHRAINETLLSTKAWKSVQHLISGNSFDGVVYYSPTIFWGGLVHKIKHRCRCPAYLVLRDMFPQWVIDAGIIKEDSLVDKYFRVFEKKSYDQADCIGLMSDKNLEVFQKKQSGYNCEILRNWASVSPVQTDKYGCAKSFRVRLSLEGKILFLYGGNIGHAQDMANLMRLARNMQEYEQAHFLFVGQGDEVELINNLARQWQLTNFTYIPPVSQDEFKTLLTEVDVGLFSLSPKHSSHNFPGKLLGYMVQSIPILGSVNNGNDLSDLVNNNCAGFIHINGEDEKLFYSAKRLLMDSELRQRLGDGANKLLRQQFSVTAAARAIEGSLEADYETNRSYHTV